MSKDLNKCPACGALRPAFAAECPECGYAFLNTHCKVVEELNSKLTALAAGQFAGVGLKRKQIELISSFAIPQIKEEILDLMVYIQPKALDKNSSVTKAWRLRQKEVIQRAKMAFAGDTKTLAQVGQYEDALIKLEKQWFRQWWQKTSLVGKIALIVVALLLLILIIPAKDVSPEAYSMKFAEAIENQHYDKALKYLKASPEMGELIADHYLTLIDALVEQERFMEAEMLYENKAHYTSHSKNEIHLSKTSCLFVEHYLKQQYYDMADKFVIDANGAILVLKALIAEGDNVVISRYFRRNQSKLTVYDQASMKRVLKVKDPEVENYLIENNLLK